MDEETYAKLTASTRAHARTAILAVAAAIAALAAFTYVVLTEPARMRAAVRQDRVLREAETDVNTVVTGNGDRPGDTLLKLTQPDIDWPRSLPTHPMHAAAMNMVWLWAPHPALLSPDGMVRESGYMVADGVAVATAHLLGYGDDDPWSTEVHVRCGDKDVIGSLQVYDPGLDVMALTVPECPGERLRMSTRPLDVNKDKLVVLGFNFEGDGDPTAYMRPSSVVPGARMTADEPLDPLTESILRETKKSGAAPLLGITGNSRHGHSGSMVLNSDGELVGMISIIQDNFGRTFVIPTKTILELVNEAGLLP